jgi:hypothetical protein
LWDGNVCNNLVVITGAAFAAPVGWAGLVIILQLRSVDVMIDLKKPFEMSFADFATNAVPSGAVNRLPAVGGEKDVYTYSVYMNGPLADQLSVDAREHEYKDVMLHALTEKVGLDSDSFRDNLKVAEIVATRSAWMSAVLDASLDRSFSLSPCVMADYELLVKGLSHPWIQEQLNEQLALSASLQPVLRGASKVLGVEVKDLAPDSVSNGTIVSQNSGFSVQALTDGEVVTHENRRLQVVPEVGLNVTVAYYRGGGQVLNAKGLKVSTPHIDPQSGDLAVYVGDGAPVKQLVLFNGMAAYAQFVKAQDLDAGLVPIALELMDAHRESVERAADAASLKSIRASMPPMSEIVFPSQMMDKRSYSGKIISDSGLHVVQDIGRNHVAVHNKRDLDGKIPGIGVTMSVDYKNGRGVVVDLKKDVAAEVGR